jgi:hypothetical protein
MNYCLDERLSSRIPSETSLLDHRATQLQCCSLDRLSGFTYINRFAKQSEHISSGAFIQVAIKVENQVERKLPESTISQIEAAFDNLPREHTRGIERIRLVEFISEPRLKGTFQTTELPGLYHPKQGPKGPWLEIAMGVLLPTDKPIHKRIVPRLSFKGNLAAIIFSLVGQHYHLTLKHSLKRTQLEPAVRAYTEKQLKAWNEKRHSFRARLFKPLQPTLERWAKTLQKRAESEKKKSLVK